jgi:Arm DNA-binding domain
MAFVTANRGRLVLDFSWKKVRCREYLGLPDTKEGPGRGATDKETDRGRDHRPDVRLREVVPGWEEARGLRAAARLR